MKNQNCPKCGGPTRSTALGWICENCRGFIALQDGKFYEHVQRPFLPPMTIADQIRSMTDEQLAEKIHSLYHNIVTGTMDDISCLFCDGKAGCITEEGNIICDEEKEKACVLRWLQRPAEED